MLERRKFLTLAAGLLAAPAIVRVASLMPVKALETETSRGFSGFYSITPYSQIYGFGVLPKATFLYMTDGSIKIIDHALDQTKG